MSGRASAVPIDRPRPIQRAWRTVAATWNEGQNDELGPVDVERARSLIPHADRNSDAEYELYRLSGRFQRFVEECLFVNERLLAFAPWTEAATETRRHRLARKLTLGGRDAVEGALLVTDRQVLLVRDDQEIGGGSLSWGYAVHATAHERIAGVAVEHKNGLPVLRIDLVASGMRETLNWTFPVGTPERVERIAWLLSGFISNPTETRLRRPGVILPIEKLFLPRPTLVGRARPVLQELASPEERARLDSALIAALDRRPAPDGTRRRVHISVIVPDRNDRPRLLAMTQEALFLIPLPDDGQPEIFDLSRVTSMAFRVSVLAHSVSWIGSDTGQPARQTAVDFPVMAAESSFKTAALVRQALTLLPVEAVGPDLTLGSDAADNNEGV